MTKKEARGFALSLREKADNVFSSQNVLLKITQSHILDSYNHIGIYYPIGKEINIISLLDFYPNKCFYLPKTKETLSFVKYEKNFLLIEGPFHTMEPVYNNAMDRNKIDCFIIPCVGISKNGKRIGYGKGYYDRYLSGYAGMKIGICYENCSCLDVECDEFDIQLDKIIVG